MPSIRTFFEENNLLGMTGVDTPALTIKARVHYVGPHSLWGAMTGRTQWPLRKRRRPYAISSPSLKYRAGNLTVSRSGKRIAVIDLGIKKNMLTSLSKRNRDLLSFPIQRHIGSGWFLQA